MHSLGEGEETDAQREGRGKRRGREGRLRVRVRERNERVETLSHRIYIEWGIPGLDGLFGLRNGPILSEAGLIACSPRLMY